MLPELFILAASAAALWAWLRPEPRRQPVAVHVDRATLKREGDYAARANGL